VNTAAICRRFPRVPLATGRSQVFPATESSGSISINQLHGECQTRIQQKRWCPTCDREVPHDELVKGYEFEKGRYVIVSADDISAVRRESTRVIDLAQFADESEFDPMYVERAYYLAPDGKTGSDAFAVMREGMHGKIGIGKLALYGREYLVAVKPKGRGMVMYTLHHAGELRTMEGIDELNSVPETVKPQEIKLARQVIDTFNAPARPRHLS
jgi:DNA end-binding protein Ku